MAVLEEEIVTPMMVGEPRTYKDPFLTHVIKEILGELELEGRGGRARRRRP